MDLPIDYQDRLNSSPEFAYIQYMNIKNFVAIDSIYGQLIVNRNCHYQAETLIKTGKTHIEQELGCMFKVVDNLPTNCLIVDGGANVGFVTIPLAQRVTSKKGTIISFEPQQSIFNCLAGSIALNDLCNITLNRAGLGSKSGMANLPNIDYSQEQDFGTVSIESTEINLNVFDHLGLQNQVAIIALDDLKLPRLDFLKLDIEGYEIEALKGGRDTIRRYRPFIWIEYWKVGLEGVIHELNDLPSYKWEIQDPLNVLFSPLEKV